MNDWMALAASWLPFVVLIDGLIVSAPVAAVRYAGAWIVWRKLDRTLRATGHRDPAHERFSGADRCIAGEAREVGGQLSFFSIPPCELRATAYKHVRESKCRSIGHS